MPQHTELLLVFAFGGHRCRHIAQIGFAIALLGSNPLMSDSFGAGVKGRSNAIIGAGRRVAALEKRAGLVAAEDRIDLRSPVDDSKISK